MANTAIVGINWDDEGKSRMVDLVTGDFDIVVRYRTVLKEAGLTLSGTSPDGRLAGTVELTERPFHVGVQYHPEFKSRPNKPHPLFVGFVKASLEGHK